MKGCIVPRLLIEGELIILREQINHRGHHHTRKFLCEFVCHRRQITIPQGDSVEPHCRIDKSVSRGSLLDQEPWVSVWPMAVLNDSVPQPFLQHIDRGFSQGLRHWEAFFLPWFVINR